MSQNDEIKRARMDMSRADRANELLNNPLYIEAITAIEAAMYAEFESTKLADEAARHELWQRMQLLKQFKGKFEDIVRKGDKARETLTIIQKSKQLIGLSS